MIARKGPYRQAFLIATALVAGLAISPAGAQRAGRTAKRWHAMVVAVHDGDTLSVRETNGGVQRIRVEGIDAPELRQRYGVEARDVLSALILKRQVEVGVRGRDRYGRILARISVYGLDVSEALVERGLAWHFTVYSDDRRLETIERAARERRVGLWQDSSPVPPWNFRSGSSLATGPPVEGPLHGNQRSHVVHAPTCPEYNCANCTRVFKTLSDAVAAGYRPHRKCLR